MCTRILPRSLSFILLICCLSASLLAADPPHDDEKSNPGHGESVDHRKVLIVPYDQAMYFSDSDKKLAKSNDKSEKQIRNLLRHGLNSRVKAQIVGKHQTHSLLTDTSEKAYRDLQRIYQAVNYHKEEAMAPKSVKVGKGMEKEGQAYREQIIEKLTKGDTKKGEQEEEVKTQAEKYKEEEVKGRYYIDVDIPSNDMLQYFNNKYGTELFLFMNQFELITNYNHCLDRATNTFERTIKVHYSIYNYTGKQLAGDVAIVKFPSNSNDLYKIIRKNFPVVGEYLAEDFPAHGEANAEKSPNNDESR